MASSRAAATFLAAMLLCSVATAADEPVRYVFPAAGARGSTIAVSVSGKFDPWPPQVWVDAPGITFKPGAKSGKFDVEIAKDAAPGPHLVRFYSDRGVSAPRSFIVSETPDVPEAEPNDEFKAPQKIDTLPATISGRLDKGGDVDSYAVTLERGQTLVAWVEAYVLASTFDGMLRIVSADGSELAFNHDGRTLDPFLAWKAPRDGSFIVQLMGSVHPATADVRLTGGDGCVYRLHLTIGPFVRHTLPLAVQRGTKAQVQLTGWNLPVATTEIDATKQTAGESAPGLLPPGILTEQSVTFSDVPEAQETEPNDTRAQAQRLEIPNGITGSIGTAGDEDRFAFTVVKGRACQFTLDAARFGSPLDGWLKIENKDGKELARNDDADGSRDPRLTWTAPADGEFFVAIGDVTHRGSAEFVYRLSIAEATPTVTATVASHSLSVTPGKSAEVKVTVKRANGFKPKLQLIAKNVPEGVSAPDVDVPDKDGEVTLKLSTAEDAKPASGPFQLALREVDGGTEHPVVIRLVTTGENNGVPQGYSELLIAETDQLWLTLLKR